MDVRHYCSAIMKNKMKLISIFLLFTLATAFGKEPFNKLIDKLVLLKSDVTIEAGNSYLKDEARERIGNAETSLVEAGRDAWPVLLQHLDDKRESIPSMEVTGPDTVGRQCHSLLSAQVVDLPEGYVQSKMRKGKDGEWHETPGMYYSFSPDLKSWFLNRGDRTLNEMKLEVIKDVLRMNDEIGYPSIEEKNRIRGLLQQQIKLLEDRRTKDEKQAGKAVLPDGK